MSAPAADISVLVGKKFACVKVRGRANFTASIDFDRLLKGLREKGYLCFVIELSECALMDSTFLGVLARFGKEMTEGYAGADGQAVELLNPNARISELLENVGVLYLFRVSQGQCASPEALEPCAHETTEHSREDLTRACLEAHETLMALNPGNVARFKDVAKFLAEDLARMQVQK